MGVVKDEVIEATLSPLHRVGDTLQRNVDAIND